MWLSDLFRGEERGVSNTISQALLFLVIISSITFIGGTVNPILDESEEKHTVEQTIEAFGEIADVSDKYHLKGSREKFSTANTTIPVNTYEGDLYTPPPTNITFRSGGESTTIQTDPIQLVTEEYIITHDAGIIQYDSLNETVRYRNPSDITRSTKDMFVLITHNVSQNFTQDTAQTHQLQISQSTPPEIGSYSNGDTISIETETDVATGWRSYIKSLPYTTIQSTNTYNSGARTRITVEITSDMKVYHQKLMII